MKTYRKPKLMVLSLSGDSLLCSCVIDVVEPGMDPTVMKMLREKYPQYVDNTSNLFATADGNDCTIQIEVVGYCKMNPTDTFKVFAS